MTPKTKYNLKVAPVVFLVRLPLLLPLWGLVWIGEQAERLGEALCRRLPGMMR